MRTRKTKTVQYFALLIACLCLLRAFSAYAEDEPSDIDYENEDDSGDFLNLGSRSTETRESHEIRLVRPGEEKTRVVSDAGDPEFEQVEGVENLFALKVEQPQNTQQAQVTKSTGAIAVPVKNTAPILAAAKKESQRGIASESSKSAPPSPISVREIPLPINRGPASFSESGHDPNPPLLFDKLLPRREIASSAVDHADDYWRSSDATVPVPSAVTDPNRRGVQEVSIIASEYGFFPSQVFVNQGQPVKIYLSTPGKNTLCFMQDDFHVKKGVSPGHVEEVVFMPDRTGDFRFYCPVKSIQGRMTVRAPAAER